MDGKKRAKRANVDSDGVAACAAEPTTERQRKSWGDLAYEQRDAFALRTRPRRADGDLFRHPSDIGAPEERNRAYAVAERLQANVRGQHPVRPSDDLTAPPAMPSSGPQNDLFGADD